MEYRTTRPQATLAACRIRRLVVVALAVLAWLAVAPVLAQTGPAQMDRVIDGDTISVRLDGARFTVVNVHSSARAAGDGPTRKGVDDDEGDRRRRYTQHQGGQSP